MIMLVIMVVGATTVLVNSLTSSTVKIARQENTAAALAQAKDALIGYSVSQTLITNTGYLLVPDTGWITEEDARTIAAAALNQGRENPMLYPAV